MFEDGFVERTEIREGTGEKDPTKEVSLNERQSRHVSTYCGVERALQKSRARIVGRRGETKKSTSKPTVRRKA